MAPRMDDFDVIRGMTWLSPQFAIFDCNAKTVTLAKPGTDPLVWEGDYTSNPVRIISFRVFSFLGTSQG